MKIILIGMKGSGKTTVGRLLSNKLMINFIELDKEIEKNYEIGNREKLSPREIYKKFGDKYFRDLENKTLKMLMKNLVKIENNFILSTGGGSILSEENRKLFKQLGIVIYLNVEEKNILERIVKNGMPAFFKSSANPKKLLHEILDKRKLFYEETASITLNIKQDTPQDIVKIIIERIKNYEN